MTMKGDKKHKQQFNTNLDAEILEEFKRHCKERNVKINVVLEQFMRDVLLGKIQIHSKIELKQD